MKKLLLIFLLLPLLSFSQLFNLKKDIPVTRYGNTLKSPWSGGINYPLWSEIDLNQDGKMDLFMFDRSNNRVITLINDGSVGQAFHDSSEKYARLFPPLDGWAVLYDYNNDGLPDLFTVSSSGNGVGQYKAVYNTSGLTFTLVNPLMLYSGIVNILASPFLIVDLDDIDGDGDMDVIGQTSTCVGGFAYYKNFSIEDYGVPDSLNDYKLASNSWGDFQLRSGAFCYTAIDTFNSPCFAPMPASLKWQPEEVAQKDDTYAQIFTIDLDGDGDKDVLIGDAGAINVVAAYNCGTPSAALMCSQDTIFPSYNTSAFIRSFATFGYADVDNDGKKDLLIGNREWEDINGVLYYKNSGTNAAPVFNYQTDSLFVGDMIDVGEAAAPVFYDYDGDGLLDLVVGGISYSAPTDCSYPGPKTSLTLYKNIGNAQNPSFQFITNDFANVSSLNLPGPVYPAFGDVDMDGDSDLYIGAFSGPLYYFENNGGVFSYTPSKNLAIGKLANTPQLVDLSGDGIADLVVGNKNGYIRYFEHTGSPSTPFLTTPTIDTLGHILVPLYPGHPDGYAVPFIFQDSGTKLLVGNMNGNVLMFDSIDNNLTGAYRFADTVLTKDYGHRFGFNITVSGGDINGDGFTDMLLGLFGGGPQVYYHDAPVAVNEVSGPKTSFNLFPNPASDNLNLSFYHLEANFNYRLSIFNTVGQIVYAINIASPKLAIDLHNFSSGLYLVQLQSEEGAVSKKIVVNRSDKN